MTILLSSLPHITSKQSWWISKICAHPYNYTKGQRINGHIQTHTHALVNTLTRSLIIIYFSSPSMYEKNFWYLFDMKKLISINYDNLKKYYINLEGFLKPDNFFFFWWYWFIFRIKSFTRDFTNRKKKTATNILNFIKELNCSKCVYCI